MISNNLKRQVRREANLLKKHATASELNKLDFFTLSPWTTYGCIYGQMTGHCYSERANQLVQACAVPVAGSCKGLSRMFEMNPAKMWVKRMWRKVRLQRDQHSAIEVYISKTGARLDNLINYLQGRTEVLDI